MLRGVGAPINVIAAGSVAGAAALAYLAPPRARRYALPHARFSLPQPATALAPHQDVAAQAEHVARQRRRLHELLASQTGQSIAAIERDTVRPAWLSAEEALAYGLVGQIVSSVRDV